MAAAACGAPAAAPPCRPCGACSRTAAFIAQAATRGGGATRNHRCRGPSRPPSPGTALRNHSASPRSQSGAGWPHYSTVPVQHRYLVLVLSSRPGFLYLVALAQGQEAGRSIDGHVPVFHPASTNNCSRKFWGVWETLSASALGKKTQTPWPWPWPWPVTKTKSNRRSCSCSWSAVLQSSGGQLQYRTVQYSTIQVYRYSTRYCTW